MRTERGFKISAITYMPYVLVFCQNARDCSLLLVMMNLDCGLHIYLYLEASNLHLTLVSDSIYLLLFSFPLCCIPQFRLHHPLVFILSRTDYCSVALKKILESKCLCTICCLVCDELAQEKIAHIISTAPPYIVRKVLPMLFTLHFHIS